VSIKSVHSQGFSSSDIFRTRGSSDVEVRTFWCKKTSNFSKFMLCPHGQGEGGLSQCEQFSDKGEVIKRGGGGGATAPFPPL